MSEQSDIDALVAEIVRRDKVAPGYALLVARGLIARMTNEDAHALIQPPPKRPVVFDPHTMIG